MRRPVSHVLRQLARLRPRLWRPFKVRPRYLPDDVITRILSRLPVEGVLKCRRVCKRWEELTSTSEFADKHLNNMNPLLFLQTKSDFSVVYPRCRKGNKSTSKVRKHPDSFVTSGNTELVGSCNGLVLLRSKKAKFCYVYNPVIQEEIRLQYPSNTGFVCGIYFNPLTTEYNVLFVESEGDNFLYYRSPITPGARWTQLAYFGYQLPYSSCATIVNGAMYWLNICKGRGNKVPPCSHGILVFDIIHDEFYTMAHPGKVCRSVKGHRRLTLLEMQRELAFCQVDVYCKYLDIWVLVQVDNEVWDKRYSINLDWIDNVCGYSLDYDDGNENYDIKPLMIQNNEILLEWRGRRGIFWFNLKDKTFGVNLKDKTIRKLKRSWLGKDLLVEIKGYDQRHGLKNSCAYTKSLISLRKRHPGL